MADPDEEVVEQYIKITVRNPRTHISREKALYTDYEIRVQTNNIAFACTDSCVRRRYSDFQWLRNRLLSQFGLEGSLPELPPKRVFGRFKRQFLRNRQKGLQEFLENLTSHTTYLSDLAVHLFLQTSLGALDIQEKMTNGSDSGGELLESPSIQKGCALSRSCSAYDDHDSGFSYSTASSLTDCVAPHSCKTSIDGCNTMDTKKADTVVSCFDYDNDEDINDSPHDSTGTPSPIMSPIPSANEPVYTHDNLNGIVYPPKLSNESISFLTSEDDGYFCSNYDADDEEISTNPHVDEHNNNNNILKSHDDDDDEFFCFRVKSDQTIYNIETALDVIRERPKLTDRLFWQEDSDDCFRESEYDVIDTDNDIDVMEVIDDTNSLNLSRIEIKVRAHTLTEEGRLIEVKTTPIREKNKLKIGKVKSIPNIRFPIRKSRSKFYKSMSEISLVSSKNHQLDTVFDEFVLQDYVTPTKSGVSESDGQQIQTSDADYLTTIHRYFSNDSQVDTNIDTQAEDIPPTKFLSMSKFKKKRRPIASLDFSFPTSKNSHINSNSLKGRFQVSTVAEVATPDIESHADKFELPNGLPENTKVHSRGTSLSSDVEIIQNGEITMYKEDPILNSYEIL